MHGICSTAFHDYLVSCEDAILINTQLTPSTDYQWVITDKFGNQYSGTGTTDAEGRLSVEVEDLPAGLLNPYGGAFTLWVQNTDCQRVPLKMARNYDEIVFDVKPGSRIKDELGCPFECTVTANPDQSFTQFFEEETEFDVEWTELLRGLYGNTPTVQVYHLVAPDTYQLADVAIQLESPYGILQNIHVNNAGAANGFIVVRA